MSAEQIANPYPDLAQAPNKGPIPDWVNLISALTAIGSGCETPIPSTPIRLLYRTALCAPFVLLIVIAVRRRMFPGRLPVRWPKNAPVLRYRNWLSLGPLAIFLLAIASSTVVRSSVGRHDPRYTIPHDAGWFVLAWFWLFVRYDSDRRPLPPPVPPHTVIWADMQPITSSHWGQRAV
jgi:hypothetical protein